MWSCRGGGEHMLLFDCTADHRLTDIMSTAARRFNAQTGGVSFKEERQLAKLAIFRF